MTALTEAPLAAPLSDSKGSNNMLAPLNRFPTDKGASVHADDESAAIDLLRLKAAPTVLLPSLASLVPALGNASAAPSREASPAAAAPPVLRTPPLVVPSQQAAAPAHQRRFSVSAVTLAPQPPLAMHRRRVSLAAVPPPSAIPAPALPAFVFGANALKRKAALPDEPDAAAPKRRYSVAAFYNSSSPQVMDHPGIIHRLPQQQQQQQQQHAVRINPLFMTRQPVFLQQQQVQYPIPSYNHQQQHPLQQPIPPQQPVISSLQNATPRRGSVASLVSTGSESESDDAPKPADSSAPVSFATSKESHKMAERARRTKMNELFDDLKNLLPPAVFADSKASKLDILAKTIEFLTQQQRQATVAEEKNDA